MARGASAKPVKRLVGIVGVLMLVFFAFDWAQSWYFERDAKIIELQRRGILDWLRLQKVNPWLVSESELTSFLEGFHGCPCIPDWVQAKQMKGVWIKAEGSEDYPVVFQIIGDKDSTQTGLQACPCKIPRGIQIRNWDASTLPLALDAFSTGPANELVVQGPEGRLVYKRVQSIEDFRAVGKVIGKETWPTTIGYFSGNWSQQGSGTAYGSILVRFEKNGYVTVDEMEAEMGGDEAHRIDKGAYLPSKQGAFAWTEKRGLICFKLNTNDNSLSGVDFPITAYAKGKMPWYE